MSYFPNDDKEFKKLVGEEFYKEAKESALLIQKEAFCRAKNEEILKKKIETEDLFNKLFDIFLEKNKTSTEKILCDTLIFGESYFEIDKDLNMKHYYHHTHRVSLPALSSKSHKHIFEFYKKRIKDPEKFEEVCRLSQIEKDDDSGIYFNKLMKACRSLGIMIR